MPNSSGQMPFHSAALSGNVELLQLLLLSKSHFVLQSRTVDRDVLGTNLVWSPPHLLEDPHSSSIDVNALGGPYGTVLHSAAYQGYLKMLQMLVEKYNAHIIVTDWLGRTPLHLAARGGDIDCVNYLLDHGLRCSNVDNIGNNVIHYACSGASTEVVQRILELDPLVVDSPSTWTPLHWACRTGGCELIQLLLSHGFHKSLVHTGHPSAWWTPVSVGVFHRNPYFESDAQQSLIKELEVPSSSCTGSFLSTQFTLDLRGFPHRNFWCNGCFHVSFIRNSSTHTNLNTGYIWDSFPLPSV